MSKTQAGHFVFFVLLLVLSIANLAIAISSHSDFNFFVGIFCLLMSGFNLYRGLTVS